MTRPTSSISTSISSRLHEDLIELAGLDLQGEPRHEFPANASMVIVVTPQWALPAMVVSSYGL
jgi:hypothetical protein